MRRINTPKEFMAMWPYRTLDGKKDKPKAKDYPKRYPCFCEVEHNNGGIMGDYMTVRIVYPPKGADVKSFAAGLKAGAQ